MHQKKKEKSAFVAHDEMSFATTFTSSRCSLSLSHGSSMNPILSSSFSSHRERGWTHQKNTTFTKSTTPFTHGRRKNLTAAASCASSNHRHHHPTTTRGKNYFQKKRTTLNETHATVNGLNASRGAKNTHSRRRPRGGGSSATIVGKSFSSSQREERRTTNDEDEDEDEEMFAEETEEEENDNVLMEAPTSRRQHRASEKENQKPNNNNNKMLTKMNQSDITSQLSRLDDAKSILEVVEEKSEQFSPNNSVQALHRIAVSLTTRAGRLRRKEAKFVLADARFSVLLDCVETHANKLDKLGLERRKWSYAKLALPSEYRMRAALSVRLLDRAKDLQGDLMDATDAGFILNRVEEQYDVFNKVNASTALHRLARVITQPNFGSNNNNSKKRAAKSRTVKSTTVVNTLGVSGATTTASERKEEDEEEGNNSDEEGGYRPVSTKKELLVDPRFQALLEMCETKIPEMSPLGLSNVSWALARLFSDDPTRVKSLLSAISKRSALQMKYADAKCLSTILWALAALGFEPRSRLLASAQRRACEIEEEFRAPDVANALWAYAKWARLFSGGVGALKESVDYSEDESVDEGSSKSYGGDRAVITSLLRQSEAVMETFSAYQCANICWSSATLNAKLPETYLENLLERIAKESDSLDGVALTHAAWAVGVVGSPVHGESDAFQTLISACADRAAIEKTTENKDENRRRRVSKAGCAGALWACGRICFEPSPEDCEKLMVRLFDGESNNLDAQALAYAVWGISTIEDVELDERRRERVMARLKELVEKENVGPTHAAAFRAAAVGAGLDASALAETLKVPA
jgi:hypothetical protein